MAVGTIPILEYPEYFNPPLENFKNCIVYTGKEDITAKVRIALNMPPNEVAKMREEVIIYYEKNLSPQASINNLTKSLDGELQLTIWHELSYFWSKA
jgi:hypothetical protein